MVSIQQYVCNLIAGNTQISTLYFSVDRARDIENKDNRFQMFSKRITFQGIGIGKIRKSFLLYFLPNIG